MINNEIKIYNKNGSELIGSLTQVVSCEAEEERNGLYEVVLTSPLTEPLFFSLAKENIIVCKPNDIQELQAFRIYNVGKFMNSMSIVYARHISFDLAGDLVDKVSLVNASCEFALNSIFRQSQYCKHYRGYSDIVNAQDYNMELSNCLEAIAGKEGSIIDTYGNGAEILRDNTNIHVLNRRGNDNGVTIEYGKNMTGFELVEDVDSLVTVIKPYCTVRNEDGSEYILRGDMVYSDNWQVFSHPYIAPIDYTDKFGEEEIPTKTKLEKLAEKEFLINKVHIPRANYKVEFIALSKCVGYEGIEDRISICDTVTIKDRRYGIDTKAKVIKYKYDVLTQKYISMEIGEPRTTLGDIIVAKDGQDGKDGLNGKDGKDGQDGKPADVEDMPDTLPEVPVLTPKVYGMGSVELSWTFVDKLYYTYELYASKTKDFTPNTFDLVHAGQSSSFMFKALPNETWYFKVCAANSHGRRTGFSNQVEVSLPKVEDMNNYFSEIAIGRAVAQSITADYMEAGIIKANWVELKGATVVDGNGKRTFDIDSWGRLTLMPSVFKMIIDGKEEDVVTQSRLEANSEQILIKVSKSGIVNELENSMFSEQRIWSLNNPAKVWYETADWYGGGVDFTTSIRFTDCTNTSAHAKQRIYPKNAKMSRFAVSGYAHYFNVNNTEGSGYPMCHWYCDIVYKDGSHTYHNFDVRNYLGNDSWGLLQWNINTEVGVKNSPIDYIDFYVYKRNTTGDFRTTKLFLHEGHDKLAWRPSSEIYNNTVVIDGEGLTVKHDNGCKSVMSPSEFSFYDQNAKKTLSIDNGGVAFRSTKDGNEIGFAKTSEIYDFNKVGVTISPIANGNYLALGLSDSNNSSNFWADTGMLLTKGYGAYEKGIHFFNFPIHTWRPLTYHNTVQLLNGATMFLGDPNAGTMGCLFQNSNENMAIGAGNKLLLGVNVGGATVRHGISIVKASGEINKVYIDSYSNWNFQNYTMYNMKNANSLQAQSFALRARVKDINDIYGTMSTTNGEVRYTCRQSENVISDDRKIIVELPQILSENIELDYHVNISKLSWGDYRIIDKNPYYFELESSVDNFSFTYEVVAKLIDKPDPYFTEASKQYINSECDEQVKTESVRTI